MRLRWYFALAAGVFIAVLIFVWVSILKKNTAKGILEAGAQVRGTEITVSSELSGKLERLTVRTGQMVEKGELIAQISSDQIEAQLA